MGLGASELLSGGQCGLDRGKQGQSRWEGLRQAGSSMPRARGLGLVGRVWGLER